MKDTIISIHVNEETKKINIEIKGENNNAIRGAFALLATKVVKVLNDSPRELLAYMGACLAIDALDNMVSRDKKEVKLNDEN